LTDERESSVPFTLGVAVKNDGYGTAFNLRITSAQPEIIENEKGLLVNFKIIGANVGNKHVSPSTLPIVYMESVGVTVEQNNAQVCSQMWLRALHPNRQ